MAYTNRTIRLAFDGSDDNYPNLGDDIYVVISNPMLMPASKLQTGTDIQLDASGNPVDPVEAMNKSMEMVANIIIDWRVYDPLDGAIVPEPLPLPATSENVQRIPVVISNAIAELVGKALNPR